MDVSEPVRAIPPYGGSRPGRLKSAAHPWAVTSAAWGYRSKEGTPDGMKLLLLTCPTGEGHNSAAQALSEAAQDLGIQAQIADPLVFGSQRAGRMAASCYNTIIRRTPRLFGAIYKAGDLYSATRLTSPVYWANSLYANGLSAYLREGGFDAVACTHLYGMEAMTALGKRGAWTAPCFGILTDYTCVPFFAETCLDGYFLPHADLLPEMVQKGVPAERIRCTGIPVSPQFDAAVDRAAARRQVGMPQDTGAYLLMSGGLGCSYVLDLCEELRRCAPAGFTAYVLAGRNARLMEELRRRYGDDARPLNNALRTAFSWAPPPDLHPLRLALRRGMPGYSFSSSRYGVVTAYFTIPARPVKRWFAGPRGRLSAGGPGASRSPRLRQALRPRPPARPGVFARRLPASPGVPARGRRPLWGFDLHKPRLTGIIDKDCPMMSF